MLDGKKTYIVALGVVVVGLIEGMLGIDIPGVEVGDNWLDYIFTGLGMGSFRSALNKLPSRFS